MGPIDNAYFNEEPKMVDQMQLRKGKTLPERQPPVAKDKGKDKRKIKILQCLKYLLLRNLTLSK